MDNLKIKALLLVTILLSGCVTSHPQTAEEFRKAVPGAFLAKKVRYIDNIYPVARSSAGHCKPANLSSTETRSVSQAIALGGCLR